ncbi:MAG: hypothetical protein ABI142_08270 [Bryocella sp.]
MNFTESSSNNKLKDDPAHKAANALEPSEPSELDKEAMEGAKRAQKRIHDNEETNSSNTIFSK